MQTMIIPLSEQNQKIYLEAYVLKSSPEFQTGKRRPAVIVCPGGAYLGTSDREAEPVALRFLALGFHAFVLRYSVQTRFPQPMLDLARAILVVRDRAAEWLGDPERVAVCGFSAGGHLAACIGVLWEKPLIHESLGVAAERIKPNALLLGYPVIDLDGVANPPVRDPQGQDLGLKSLSSSLALPHLPCSGEPRASYAILHITVDRK